jgi:hypothetical protein
MTDNPFEIPHSMHELAEQKLKQAHAGYDHVTAYLNHAMGTWLGAVPPNPMAISLNAVQDHARTAPEFLTLQTQYVQNRMQTFAKQAPDSAS